MSYNKTTWDTGDVVTAEKLNNIEDGIENASGVLIIEPTIVREGSNVTHNLHTSFNDMKSALLSGKNILAKITTPQPPEEYIEELGISESEYDPYTYVPFSITGLAGLDAASRYTISFTYNTILTGMVEEVDVPITDPDADIVLNYEITEDTQNQS